MKCPKCGKKIISMSFYMNMPWNNAIHEIKIMPPFGFPEIAKSCSLEKEIYPEGKLKADWKAHLRKEAK